MPEFDSFSIMSNCRLRVRGRTFEVDLVVIPRSATGVIEVDGHVHERMWASDRSRDEFLEDNGIAYVSRIHVLDVCNPGDLEKFIRRFLIRLHQRAAA